MNKKLKLQVWMQWGALALAVLLVGGVVAVKAYYGNAPKVVVEGNYIEAQQIEPIEQPQELGGFNPNITEKCINFAGEVVCTISGSFINASTTIVSIPDPFRKATSTDLDVVLNGTLNNGYGLTGATSTVDLVRLDVRTAATSTYSVSCGASAGIATADSVSLLDTAANAVATSTTGLLENKLTAALGGLVDAGTVEKVALGSQYPYFTCTVTSVYTGAFTEDTNAFDGKYTVVIRRSQ